MFRRVRSHFALLLVLAVVLGGLLFLFELFGGLTSDGPKDLLTTNDSADSTAEMPSGARLIALLTPGMFVLLGIGALALLRRRLKHGHGRRWAPVLLGAMAVGLLGSGVYLSVGTVLGGVDDGGHSVATEYVTPLGLTLLAAFIVTVGVVAVTKPRLLPIPLIAWLVPALIFGMLGSNAIAGMNLFNHHSKVETTQGYENAVNVYWQAGVGPPAEEGQPGNVSDTGSLTGAEYHVNALLHGTPEERAEAVSELVRTPDPAVVPPLVQALGDSDEEVTTAAREVLQEALESDDPEVKQAAESALVEALGDGDLIVRAAAERIMEEGDNFIALLESGGALVYLSDRVYWAPGTTTDTASEPATIAVFEVTGASATGYLRVDVGDEYTGQGWVRLDPVELSYPARTPTQRLVYSNVIEDEALEILPRQDAATALLAWPESSAEETLKQRITISAPEQEQKVPAGSVPTSIGADFFDADGRYRPFSGTFSTDQEVEQYGWTSTVHRFSEDQLRGAQTFSDSAALALPEIVTERVRLLAEEITGEHASPYEKARALVWYLRETYEYEFVSEDDEALPENGDAVDRFLFETMKGTCGDFSSAFVVLARSVGIPARVVSGWVIEENAERQTVYTDQAHQWAEVAFEELGWRRFEPTHINGPPFRAQVTEVWEDELHRLEEKLFSRPDPGERIDAVDDLVEYSTKAPSELRDVSSLLIGALGGDEAVEVRARSAEALGDKAYWNARHALITALYEDGAEEVRAASAEALVKLRGEDSVRALIRALQTDESPKVRTISIAGLTELKDLRAIGPILGALSDPIEEVREAAKAALKELGATVTELEGGGRTALVEGQAIAFNPSTTTAQAQEPPQKALFEVTATGAISYLRTGVGDIYEDGRWTQTDPVEASFEANELLVAVERLASGRTDRRPPPSSSLAPHLASESTLITVRISPLNSGEVISAGVIPAPEGMRIVSEPGVYMPYSSTVRINDVASEVLWTARTVEYDEDILTEAQPYDDPAYTQLPGSLPEQIGELARRITEGHAGTYAQAVAIQDYLRQSYSYAFAAPGAAGPPASQDPVDWFLFDSRQGTCGQFSSAFVVLARSVGIPARVVSGWTIGRTDATQTVYAHQAHQWAEVALDEIGWVPLEPTAQGAPSRTPDFDSGEAGSELSDESDGSTDADDTTTIPPEDSQAISDRVAENLDILGEDSGTGLHDLNQLLGDTRPGYGEAARELLEQQGASVTELENGTSLVVFEDQGYWVPGTTTSQAPGLAHNPIFQVRGAAHTGYLRTAVGDLYENGKWRQLHQAGFWVLPGQNVPHAVRKEMAKENGAFSGIPPDRLAVSLLAGFQTTPVEIHTDVIRMNPIGEQQYFPDGTLPTSLHVQSIDTLSWFWAHNLTLGSADPVSGYIWTSKVPYYSETQLIAARASSDPTYTQLPLSVPDRVRQKALEVTRGFNGPYGKAKALERFLSTTYAYAFADSPGDAPPAGRDPVDWFLFDHQEGTCGVFSSAFVVMARSIGIPARVVSGWMISDYPGTQTVFTDQAHQWAEIALDGIGWLTIEPTAAGGAPSRVSRAGGASTGSSSVQIKRGTVTEIDQWPTETRKGIPFTIGGSVLTLSGNPVNGIEVEVFVNEEKENGGWRLGTTTTEAGRFEIEVTVPTSFEPGSYQLIAHAIDNEAFEGSWSDPEVGVYSGTELIFSGPTEISVDVKGIFHGTLTEETGGSLGGRMIQVRVEGESPFQVTTDNGGEFGFTRTFEQSGERTVEVSFDQEGYFLSNEARLDIRVTMPTVLSIDAVDRIRVGEEYKIRGRLRDVRGEGPSSKQIKVTLPSGEVVSAETDVLGAFTVTGIADQPGMYGLEASFGGDGVLEPSKTGYTLLIINPVVLELSGYDNVRIGEEYVVRGTLKDSRGTPLAQSEVLLTMPEGVTSVLTDEQGAFEVSDTTDQPGRYDIEASFAGNNLLEPGSAAHILSVVEPVNLDLSGEPVVRVGAPYRMEGTLSSVRGQVLEGHTLIVSTGPDETVEVVTGPLGSFAWETTFEEETETAFKVRFAGTDELEPAQAALSVKVGRVQIVVEDPEPVARGSTLTLRGVMELSGQTVPDAIVSVNGEQSAATNAVGVFVVRVPVDTDAELGEMEFTVLAVDLEAETMVSVQVMSTTSFLVTPQDDVKPGRPVLVEARLLDDFGMGVPGVAVKYGETGRSVTDEFGAALLTVDVPDEDDLSIVPLRVSYEGDEANFPVSYLATLQIQKGGSGWLIWALLPVLLILGLGGGYLGGRRFGRRTVLASVRASAPPTTISAPQAPVEQALEEAFLEMGFVDQSPEARDAWQVGERVQIRCVLSDGVGRRIAEAEIRVEWGDGDSVVELVTDRKGECSASWTGNEPGLYQVKGEFAGTGRYLSAEASLSFEIRLLMPTRLEVIFAKPADDLPPVWGVGEEVRVAFALTDDAGRGLEGRPIRVAIGDAGETRELTSGNDGRCELVMTGETPGEYRVEAEFQGDEGHLPSDARDRFEVVEFRDDVVRRYNAFLAGVREKVSGISPKATPREVESIVVARGLPLDQRALEELIARFEEADYSEHEIARQQFEAAYRAWRRLEKEQE